MTELCARYGVSRKTGYKWLRRYEAAGLPGMADRSRAPPHCPHRLAAPLARLLSQAARELAHAHAAAFCRRTPKFHSGVDKAYSRSKVRGIPVPRPVALPRLCTHKSTYLPGRANTKGRTFDKVIKCGALLARGLGMQQMICAHLQKN